MIPIRARAGANVLNPVKPKKKKKPTLPAPTSETPDGASLPGPSVSKSRRKAKDGGKTKEVKEDDFDEIMAQMATK